MYIVRLKFELDAYFCSDYLDIQEQTTAISATQSQFYNKFLNVHANTDVWNQVILSLFYLDNCYVFLTDFVAV